MTTVKARVHVRDAGDELERALRLDIQGFGAEAEIVETSRRRWASITFSGEHHRLALRLCGAAANEAADRFCHGLAERQFDLRGHILADIALLEGSYTDESGDVRLILEALTVEAS